MEIEVEIPHEVLSKVGNFKVGIYGTTDTKTLPTLWSDNINVEYGTDTVGIAPPLPTPNVYNQLIELEKQAVNIAQSVRDDANNGVFKGDKGDKGYTPQKGVDYFTEEDIKNLNIPTNLVNGSSTGSLRNVRARTAIGTYAFAEGYDTQASGYASHSEGIYTIASGNNSHSEGYETTASGSNSHSEGVATKSLGYSSHSEGEGSTASGYSSHSEGRSTKATGFDSHAEGKETIALGDHSHSEGNSTIASKSASHAEGRSTKASSNYQHVQGKYNVEDSDSVYADIVGNGTSSKSSNAYTLDWQGNAWYSGDVYVGSTSGTNRDEGSKKLATEEYIDTQITENIDQTYTPESENAQSGKAVAEAVTEAKDYTDTKIGDIDTALDNIIALQNSYIGR